MFGTPPQDIAPLPDTVPLLEIDVALPWARPVPQIFWFDKRLRVWFSAQEKPAPLAIVISGTGSDGNTAKLSMLRAVLYGAGYHVLTVPSPTFPGFIVSASSTGVAGDLMQDGQDLYAALVEIVAHLPRKVRITDVDVLGYSLGGANAAIVKSIDATEHKLNIHRAVMIKPPVSLFASIGRLDKLFAVSLGDGDAGIERLYQQLYAAARQRVPRIGRVQIDENFLLGAAAAVLKTDAEFSAAIALTFRIELVQHVLRRRSVCRSGRGGRSRASAQGGRFAGGDRASSAQQAVLGVFHPGLRAVLSQASAEFDGRFADRGKPARRHRRCAAHGPDYYAQTNSDDLILDRRGARLAEDHDGPRIAVYDHGGHLGNLGDRQQAADMLDMLDGRWPGSR